jgi:hypothetical protein
MTIVPKKPIKAHERLFVLGHGGGAVEMTVERVYS